MAGTLFSANMRTEMAVRPRTVYPVLEITLSGSTLRLSGERAPSASLTNGFYDNRITRWGQWSRSAASRNGALSAFTGEIEYDDTDLNLIANLYKLNKQPAVVKLASPSLASVSDWFTFFSGVIGSIREVGGGKWGITLRQDDEKLNANFPKGRLTGGDWPNIHSSAVGKPIPIIYGNHTGGAFDAVVAVPCFYVDTSTYRWAVAGHYCKTVPKVYLKTASTDWTLKTVTTDYTLAYPIVAGRQYTVIVWNANPGTDPEVKATVTGIETVGDGSGTLISNPSTAMKHLLVNWIFGDYRKGAWLADATAPVDTTLFTALETFCTVMGLLVTRRIANEARRGSDELNMWADSFKFQAFWTNAGKIGAKVFDHRLQNADIYPADRIQAVAGGDVINGDIGLEFDDQAYVPRIHSSYGPVFDQGAERFSNIFESQDAYSISTNQTQEESRWWVLDGVQPRNTSARFLNRYRSLMPGLRATLGIEYLDYEMLSHFGVSWARGPNEDGTAGWGEKAWQRRLFGLIETVADLDALTVRCQLQDEQPAMASQWSSYKNVKRVSQDREGEVGLNLGEFEQGTRASVKQTDDPSGSVVQLAANIHPVDMTGLLVEGASTNQNTRSSSVSGTTGLTLAGTGVNGSAIAADTAVPLLFETASTQSLKFTAGSPMAAELSSRYPDTASFNANALVRISIDHKDDSGATFYYRVQRLFDNNYWTDSSQTWGAGSVDNPLTNTTAIARHFSKQINVGANATALRVWVLQQTGGTASRVNRVYHVDIEESRFVTTRKVTDGSTFTRALDSFSIVNDGTEASGTHEWWPRLRGTIELKIVTLWDAADLASGATPYVLSLEYDASNKWELYYDKNATAWKFKIRAGGTDYTATSPTHSPARGTSFDLAVRWTSSSEAELNLTALTASIFVNSVKGTDVVYATPTFAGAKLVYLGAKTGSPVTDHLWGAIGWQRVSPFCKPDGLISLSIPI